MFALLSHCNSRTCTFPVRAHPNFCGWHKHKLITLVYTVTVPFSFFELETRNNRAYDGRLSFSYIILQTPAVDLDYLYRWVLADSCYLIIPQVQRCLDSMTNLFFMGVMKNCA